MTQGLTLVEMLIVLAILGILAAICVPAFIHLRTRPYDTANQQCHRALLTQLATYRTVNNGTLPSDVTGLPSIQQQCQAAGVHVRDGASGTPQNLNVTGNNQVTPIGPASFSFYTWHPSGRTVLFSSPSQGRRFERLPN